MKLKCNDGIVRKFSVAYTDGDYLTGGRRANGSSDAYCVECGNSFGCHDTYILKPKFKNHVCKDGVPALTSHSWTIYL